MRVAVIAATPKPTKSAAALIGGDAVTVHARHLAMRHTVGF